MIRNKNGSIIVVLKFMYSIHTIYLRGGVGEEKRSIGDRFYSFYLFKRRENKMGKK